MRNENTRGNTGWCLDPHDLAVAKLVAGREKDGRFVAAAARHGLLDRTTLLARLEEAPVSRDLKAIVEARIHRAFAA